MFFFFLQMSLLVPCEELTISLCVSGPESVTDQADPSAD